MITTLTLDATMIGQMIGAPDQYINRLEVLSAPSPAWQADGWQASPHPHGSFANGGKFVLRDQEGLGRPLLAFNPTYAPTPVFHGASMRYHGNLFLENCPKGAVYELAISDVPVKAWSAA